MCWDDSFEILYNIKKNEKRILSYLTLEEKDIFDRKLEHSDEIENVEISNYIYNDALNWAKNTALIRIKNDAYEISFRICMYHQGEALRLMGKIERLPEDLNGKIDILFKIIDKANEIINSYDSQGY